MQSRLLLVTLLGLSAVALVSAGLPSGITIAPNSTAVAGLSAGAYMAVQFHIAFSSSLVGAGVIAGGPFYCAKDTIINAEVACMNVPEEIDIQSLITAAKDCASSSSCDPVENLASERAWLFSGSRDTVVNPGVMHHLVTFYNAFMDATRVNSTFDLDAEHSWPTSTYGNACPHLGSPYINNCDYDASYLMLNFIFNQAFNAPVAAKSENKYSFSQADYTPNKVSPSSISLEETAYAYIPAACTNGTACKFVVVFHGCEQTLNDIGTVFVDNIGMNEIAEANNIVVLYPQAKRSDLFPENPNGCFDWWGYTNSDYANKNGPQMQTVYNMVKAISG